MHTAHQVIMQSSPRVQAEMALFGIAVEADGRICFVLDDAHESWAAIQDWVKRQVDAEPEIVTFEASDPEDRLLWLQSCVTSYEPSCRVVPGMRDYVEFAFGLAADLGTPLTFASGISARGIRNKGRCPDPQALMSIALGMLDQDEEPVLWAFDHRIDPAVMLSIPFWHQLNDTVFDEAITRLGLQPSLRTKLDRLGPRSDDVALRMANHTALLMEGIGAVYGLVGRENDASLTTDREGRGQRSGSPTNHLEEVDRVARGSFWCNCLTDKHIETLGGVDRIRREAPCAIVEESERTGPVTTQVRLQVTERFSETTWEMLDELEEYLDPLLP